MLPVQEINISTKNRRLFFVHLECWREDHFECKLAAIDLGPKLQAFATFGPYAKAPTALSAFRALIDGLRAEIASIDPTDSVTIIDNPCNAEFVSAPDQQNIAGRNVVIKVNGAVT